jgi:hypothetical protein
MTIGLDARARLAAIVFTGAIAMSAFMPPTIAQAADLPLAPAATTKIGDPRLNGFWFIDEAARTAGTASAKAELSPAGQEQAKRNAAAAAANPRGPVGLGTFTCGEIGLPFIIGTSEPWLLVLTKDEVIQYTERREIPQRYFYTDGRPWPELSKLKPNPSGFSLAHWEGKTLVITTIGLPPGGIQGRGLKGPNTVLTERVSLDDTGNRLQWNYSWEDSVLMTKPVSYSLYYDRGEKGVYALTHDCDPNENPARLIDYTDSPRTPPPAPAR